MYSYNFLDASFSMNRLLCSLCRNPGYVRVHPGYPDGRISRLRHAGNFHLPDYAAPGGSGAYGSVGAVYSGGLPVTVCGVCVDARLSL